MAVVQEFKEVTIQYRYEYDVTIALSHVTNRQIAKNEHKLTQKGVWNIFLLADKTVLRHKQFYVTNILRHEQFYVTLLFGSKGF